MLKLRKLLGRFDREGALGNCDGKYCEDFGKVYYEITKEVVTYRREK